MTSSYYSYNYQYIHKNEAYLQNTITFFMLSLETAASFNHFSSNSQSGVDEVCIARNMLGLEYNSYQLVSIRMRIDIYSFANHFKQ